MAKCFTAYHKMGESGLDAAIIEVIAENEDDARAKIKEQLQRPGRDWYLDKWEQSGQIIKETT